MSELRDPMSTSILMTGCSVERIYVHSAVYDAFVKKFVEVARAYKLGDPTDPSTSLGPVVSLASAERIRKQVKDAGEQFAFYTSDLSLTLVASGAVLALGEDAFEGAKEGTTLVGPQVLVNVDHCEHISCLPVSLV